MAEKIREIEPETEGTSEKKYPRIRICSNCKKELGTAGMSSVEGEISHGLCEDCLRKLYGDEMADNVLNDMRQEKEKEK